MRRSSRRDFVCRAGQVLGAAAMAAGLRKFGQVSVLAASKRSVAPTNYKALVCIFLDGGNDCNNTIIPMSTAGYGAYSAARGAAGLALSQGELDPFRVTPLSIGDPFAFHPSLSAMQQLFTQNKLAVVPNVGPLVEPLTRDEYLNDLKRAPYSLFSHSDQVTQWETSVSNRKAQTGWGGRLADRLGPLNGGSAFPMILSVCGVDVFGLGAQTLPLAVDPAWTPVSELLALEGFGTGPEETARRAALDQLTTVDRGQTLVKVTQNTVRQATAAADAFTVDPVVNTAFPDTYIGNQLLQVAKLIKLNLTQPQPNLERQIFFCCTGGYDTHEEQLAWHADILQELSVAMKAFYDATVELSVANRVTTFTLSDFGRTLDPAGSGSTAGSDHGWGGHMLVMGDAVNGGNFYGVQGPNGTVFPTLQLQGPNDADDRGRWIPTASVDQYAATLASWYGLTNADLATVFPNIGNFATANLGFMV